MNFEVSNCIFLPQGSNSFCAPPAPKFLTFSELAFWRAPESLIYKESLKVEVLWATSRDIGKLIESSSKNDG